MEQEPELFAAVLIAFTAAYLTSFKSTNRNDLILKDQNRYQISKTLIIHSAIAYNYSIGKIHCCNCPGKSRRVLKV